LVFAPGKVAFSLVQTPGLLTADFAFAKVQKYPESSKFSGRNFALNFAKTPCSRSVAQRFFKARIIIFRAKIKRLKRLKRLFVFFVRRTASATLRVPY
jgi:hypothetical protein